MVDKVFEQATRMKFRFPSAKGELSCEQLWDVPLRSDNDFNLDKIARGIHREFEAASEESFVDTTKNSPAKRILEAKLNITKYVIGVKLEEEVDAKILAENRVKKAELLRALAEKQQGQLSDMSVKELKKQIEALEV